MNGTKDIVNDKLVAGFEFAQLLRYTMMIDIDLNGKLEMIPIVRPVNVNGRFSSSHLGLLMLMSAAWPGTKSTLAGRSSVNRLTLCVTSSVLMIFTICFSIDYWITRGCGGFTKVFIFFQRQSRENTRLLGLSRPEIISILPNKIR
jgi:hypothetical protein